MIQNLLVWDALIAWRDDVLKKDLMRKTRANYLSHMFGLIEKGILNLEKPLSEFLKTTPEDKLKIIENTSWSQSTKLFRYTILRSFYKFSKKKNIKRTFIGIPKENGLIDMNSISELLSSNEDKTRSQDLTFNDFNNFLLKMRELNQRDFLICWTMWELKCTVRQVLKLSVNDIDYLSGVFVIEGDGIRQGELRADLRKLLYKESEGKKDLIFLTNLGNPVQPAQLVRTMKKASKLAKLPIIISPKILYAHAKAHYERILLTLPENEKKKVFESLSAQYKRIFKKA